MKSIVTITVLLIVLAAVPAMAQKIYIDYDKAVDFSQYTTFAFVETGEDLKDTDPLVHDRVTIAIIGELAGGGMREVADGEAQLFVTYHSAEKQETRLSTSHMGYGWGGDWHWDGWGYGSGMGSSTTQVINYTIGTLNIDIFDTDKRLIWRASASGIVSDKPAKDEKKINKAVRKIAKKWDKMSR